MKKALIILCLTGLALSGCASTKAGEIIGSNIFFKATPTPEPIAVPTAKPAPIITPTPSPTPSVLYLPHLLSQGIKFGMSPGDIALFESNKLTQHLDGILSYDSSIGEIDVGVYYFFDANNLQSICYAVDAQIKDPSEVFKDYCDLRNIYVGKYGEPYLYKHDATNNYYNEWDLGTYKIEIHLNPPSDEDIEAGTFSSKQLLLGVVYTSFISNYDEPTQGLTYYRPNLSESQQQQIRNEIYDMYDYYDREYNYGFSAGDKYSEDVFGNIARQHMMSVDDIKAIWGHYYKAD